MAYADSPTNLLWRLQNEQAPTSRQAPKKDEPEVAIFTELNIEVRAEDLRPGGADASPWGAKR